MTCASSVVASGCEPHQHPEDLAVACSSGRSFETRASGLARVRTSSRQGARFLWRLAPRFFRRDLDAASTGGASHGASQTWQLVKSQLLTGGGFLRRCSRNLRQMPHSTGAQTVLSLTSFVSTLRGCASRPDGFNFGSSASVSWGDFADSSFVRIMTCASL